MSNARNIADLPNGDDAPIYACRAWVNFRGTSQSGTATASGLVTGLYTATVVTATQFTVEYSGTTYTINTSGNHDIGDGEGVDLTVSGTTVTIDTQIRESGNVSSCQDNGTGDYTVTFSSEMPDGNYTVATSAKGDETGAYGRIATSAYANDTTSTRVLCVHSRDWTLQDMTTVTVAIFR